MGSGQESQVRRHEGRDPRQGTVPPGASLDRVPGSLGGQGCGLHRVLWGPGCHSRPGGGPVHFDGAGPAAAAALRSGLSSAGHTREELVRAGQGWPRRDSGPHVTHTGADLPAKPTSPSQGWSELTQALHVLMPRRPGLRVGPWNPREQRRTEDMKPKPLAGRQARPGLQPRVGSNALQCAVKNGGGRRALGCRARVGTQTPKPRPSAPTSVHRGQAHPPPTPRDCLDGPAHGRPLPSAVGRRPHCRCGHTAAPSAMTGRGREAAWVAKA